MKERASVRLGVVDGAGVGREAPAQRFERFQRKADVAVDEVHRAVRQRHEAGRIVAARERLRDRADRAVTAHGDDRVLPLPHRFQKFWHLADDEAGRLTAQRLFDLRAYRVLALVDDRARLLVDQDQDHAALHPLEPLA